MDRQFVEDFEESDEDDMEDFGNGGDTDETSTDESGEEDKPTTSKKAASKSVKKRKRPRVEIEYEVETETGAGRQKQKVSKSWFVSRLPVLRISKFWKIPKFFLKLFSFNHFRATLKSRAQKAAALC